VKDTSGRPATHVTASVCIGCAANNRAAIKGTEKKADDKVGIGAGDECPDFPKNLDAIMKTNKVFPAWKSIFTR